jgi:hypothetical protein
MVSFTIAYPENISEVSTSLKTVNPRGFVAVGPPPSIKYDLELTEFSDRREEGRGPRFTSLSNKLLGPASPPTGVLSDCSMTLKGLYTVSSGTAT